MSSKRAVWLSFFLNLSYAIVEFIAGGVFGSSAVLADSVHDLGDAVAIGVSAVLETISNREEDSQYTLGYKRFSLLGALITAVILMTGSVFVILENTTKLFNPQPVNDEGILWLGIIAVTINVLASLVVRKGKTKNESILSLRFWSTLKIFLDAVPEGVDIEQVRSDLEQLEYVASVNQLNLWTMDGLEKNAIVHVCLEQVKHMEVCKESIRDLFKERGFQNVTIEVDSSPISHAHHKRRVDELKSLDRHRH